MKNLISMFRRVTLGGMFALLLCLSCFAQQTMPLGFYGQVPFRTGNVAVGTATLVVGQMSGLLTGTPVAAATYTTPTAALLCALFPFVGANGANNYWWDWTVKNTSAGANTITLAGGTGVTIVGTTTTVQNSLTTYRIVLTACPIPGTTAPTAVAQAVNLGTSVF